jgi:hypothetical protein
MKVLGRVTGSDKTNIFVNLPNGHSVVVPLFTEKGISYKPEFNTIVALEQQGQSYRFDRDFLPFSQTIEEGQIQITDKFGDVFDKEGKIQASRSNFTIETKTATANGLTYTQVGDMVFANGTLTVGGDKSWLTAGTIPSNISAPKSTVYFPTATGEGRIISSSRTVEVYLSTYNNQLSTRANFSYYAGELEKEKTKCTAF